MIGQLSKEGYALIMTTHNPEQAILLGGKVAILDREGVLGVGPSEEMLTSEVLTNLYGLQIKTRFDEDAGRNICFVC